MNADSPHLYRLRGAIQGRDQYTLRAAIQQAARVEARGLAAVLTLRHLAHRTGAPYTYLREIVSRRRDAYHVFQIRRRSGRTPRVISSPDPTLMHVQRWMLAHILNHAPVHPAAYAYRRRLSISHCAARHLGANWLIKLDLHNFFHSIDERQVYAVFLRLGYASLPSFEMARLCTRQATPEFPNLGRFQPRPHRERIISDYTTTMLGYLPQGAPTSGALANIVAEPIDERLNAIADEHDLVYTRYADDITFSGLSPFDRRHAARIVRLARTAVHTTGFEVHDRKTHIVPPGARRIVLGLLVDGERLRLPRDTRARIDAHIYGAERFGLANHQTTRGFASLLGLIRYVDGLLAFAHDIDSQWASPRWQRWREVIIAQAPDMAPFRSVAAHR
ncbi:reverse transcriptase family protein [Microbispora corallina]|uniref:reverse transcriptase family protein n=1 Tax=Microbispora corallina TaxID=83302 RepID=UPI003556B70F